MKAAFDREYVSGLRNLCQKGKEQVRAALQLKDDIENFRTTKKVSRS